MLVGKCATQGLCASCMAGETDLMAPKGCELQAACNVVCCMLPKKGTTRPTPTGLGPQHRAASAQGGRTGAGNAQQHETQAAA
jgi:hypothetical protein